MKIYIHTGMHKTGTTSIQHALVSNLNKLETLGYRIFVGLPQINAKRPERFDPSWIKENIKLAEKENMRAIIFSSEVISSFNLIQLQNLLEPFDGYEVNLITCFRHWIGFLPSRWAQNSLRRDSQSFPLFLSNLQQFEETHNYARFDLVINNMIAVKPYSIKLVSYDHASKEDLLLSTVFLAFGLPQLFINDLQVSTKRKNTRKDFALIELVRLFNGMYSMKNALEYNELFESINQSTPTPIKNFYNFSDLVDKFLHENKILKKQLIEIINQNKIRIVLSRKDQHIAAWERMAEEASSNYIVNPYKSSLFYDVPDSEIICSKIEVDDIPSHIQQQMLGVFIIR